MVTGKIIARYCREHLDGEDYDIRRKDFATGVNDSYHGYRQESPKTFGIVSDTFPIIERQ